MKLVKIQDNKNNIVKKHQELVHSARYTLSEMGIKTVSMLISMIKVNDEDFQEYHIKVNDFINLTNSNSKNISKYVEAMTDDLMNSPFKIGDYKFNWCYLAHYKEGENTVMLKVAPELKPYLLNLKEKFLTYNIINILSLKSTYIIRLYELCSDKLNEHIRYKTQSKSYQFEITVDRLRHLFQIPESYRYDNIKARILNKSVIQFKQKTDIQITYKEIKLGRKVTILQITVKPNNKGSNDFLHTQKSFIDYMRKNYINQDVAIITKPNSDEILYNLSISGKGKLYDKNTSKDFDSSQSEKMWEMLYKLAQDDKLMCLKQGKLF